MIFAKFYAIDDDEIKEVCVNGTLIINARLSPLKIGEIARNECMKRGFGGYRIFKGESFSNSIPLSCFWPVPNKPDNSSMSAYWGA